MFIIERNGKRFSKKKFNNYEEARSYVRKTIRRYMQMLNLRYPLDDISGVFYSNPSINLYGYSINGK